MQLSSNLYRDLRSWVLSELNNCLLIDATDMIKISSGRIRFIEIQPNTLYLEMTTKNLLLFLT